jgi:hypothetical protein
VGQEVAQRDRCAHGFVLHAESPQVATHRGVQLQLALLDQRHGRGRGHGLGQGGELEDGVGRDRPGILDAGHAQPPHLELAVLDDAERGARIPCSRMRASTSRTSSSNV